MSAIATVNRLAPCAAHGWKRCGKCNADAGQEVDGGGKPWSV